MADWFRPTVELLPFAAWMFIGVGVPWALVLLPRGLWSSRITVLAVGMALGPLGLTSVMFVLGTAGRLTLTGTMIGSLIVAGVGAVLALRRRVPPRVEVGPRRPRPGIVPPPPIDLPLARFEWMIAGGIALLILINVVVSAYWPFIAYDPLWVYGYNAKIFVLHDKIPTDMGYYPQMLPLSYTYMQQAWGGINDHAARVVIPWFNLTAALMAYVLGRLAYGSRRIGLLTAAIWAFYPHVQAWAGAGDLEIPLTLYMTGAAAFFIDAWRTERVRSAALSGVLFSGALWTKPTAGAFAIGVILAIVGWSFLMLFRLPVFGPKPRIFLLLERGILSRFWVPLVWSKLKLALITGLTAAPLGGMWYVRNLLLHHDPLVFPAGYWHDFAQRSGQELGWPLLIALLVAGWLLVRPPIQLRARRRVVRLGLPILAIILLLVGTLPTALPDRLGDSTALWKWVRGDITAARRLSGIEVGMIVLGVALLVLPVRGAWRSWSNPRRETTLLLTALLLPYGVVWFLYFSYHYRLSFPIVPMLAAVIAAIVDWWLWPWLVSRPLGKWIGGALTVMFFAMAVGAASEFTVKHWRQGGLKDDRAKYDAGNPALMVVVHHLEDYAAAHGQPVVMAPGEDRLPFFFPTWDVRVPRDPKDLPTKVEDLDGVDIIVGGSVLDFLWLEAGEYPNSLKADMNVGETYYRLGINGPGGTLWPTVMQPIALNLSGAPVYDDGIFRYVMFTIHPEARTTPLRPGGTMPGETVFGGFARLLGFDMVSLDWYRGERVPMILYWQPTETAPPPVSYSVYIHILDSEGNLVRTESGGTVQWDGVPMLGQYPTLYWRPGEAIYDFWDLRTPVDAAPGPVQVRIGLYDSITGQRVPVTIDGEPAGDGVTISNRVTVR